MTCDSPSKPSRPGAFGLQRLQAENGREIFGKVPPGARHSISAEFCDLLFYRNFSQILDAIVLERKRNPRPQEVAKLWACALRLCGLA